MPIIMPMLIHKVMHMSNPYHYECYYGIVAMPIIMPMSMPMIMPCVMPMIMHIIMPSIVILW